MRNKTLYACLSIAFTLAALAGTVHAGKTLDAVIARGDDDWFTIVKWLVYALVEAEEKA